MSGRSRSRSPARRSPARGSRSRSRSSGGVTTIKVSDAEAAFVKGKFGKTRDRLANVSGAQIDILERDLLVEIRGTPEQQKKAKKYVNYVITQRDGPVLVPPEDDDGDLTRLMIPQRAVGFVTGKQGNFLRMIETEWNTLMFFVAVDKGKNFDKEYEELAIWGDLRGRRGSELKALNAVETMCPGNFEKIRHEIVPRNKGDGEDGDWDTDTLELEDSKVSYALGKQGLTRKKVEIASGAVVQYLGNTGLYSGNTEQRRRAKDYMKYLFGQLDGPVYVDGWQDREDCAVVTVPIDIVPYITGARRAALSSVEDKYGAIMFFMNKAEMKREEGRESEQLIIFGDERGRRGAEVKIQHEIEWKKSGTLSPGIREHTSDKKGFAVDVMKVDSEDINYLIGKKGSTGQKIEKAVGCWLIYVANFAHIGGDIHERTRCREYLNWLLKQLKGPVTVTDIKSRDDCTEVWVPQKCKGIVMGNRGMELRRVEQETGVFSFMALDDRGEERLCIFSKEAGSKDSKTGRAAAERMIQDTIRNFERGRDRRNNSRGRGRDDSRRRDDSRPRQRERSPRRNNRRSDSRPPPRRDDSRPPPRRNDSRPPPRRNDSRGRGGNRR